MRFGAFKGFRIFKGVMALKGLGLTEDCGQGSLHSTFRAKLYLGPPL